MLREVFVMATPLACTDRIQLSYVFAGLTHRLRAYVVLLDPPGPTATLAKRGGGPGILWTDAAQYWWDKARTILSSTVTAADALLQHLDGVSWNTVAAYTATGAGPATSAQLTQQVSIVLRDQAFQLVRANVFETDQLFTGHDTDGSAISTNVHNLVLAYTTNTHANAMFNWQRGRGASLISNTGGAVGVTLGQNRQIKRARGLA